MRPALLGGAVAVAAAVWVVADGGGGREPAASATARTATATAVARRRRLVDREDVDGRLAYAGARTVSGGAAGTITGLRREGSVARRGASLYAVDERPTGFVLPGRTPAYRALSKGVADGEDVRQLEANLAALGHDPARAMTVDRTFDAATAAAVKRWERARGVTEDGKVDLGDVVFTRGAVRVGEHAAKLGDRVAPGRPVLQVTSRRRVVTARLPAGRQGLVRPGDAVTVTLPDGTTARGRVRSVGRVARTARDGGEATVGLQVVLRGRAARSLRLDGAPVTVSVARTTATTALSVPVQALVATGARRYAVEVVEEDRTRLVPVEVGVFGDGFVAVSGRGLREGARVVIPR